MELVSEAAATVGGTPIIIKIGVIRNPPPTPTNPERKPTNTPTATTRNRLMLIPATGRRMCIVLFSPLVADQGVYAAKQRSDPDRRRQFVKVDRDNPGRGRSDPFDFVDLGHGCDLALD